jgi:hypothetical protein
MASTPGRLARLVLAPVAWGALVGIAAVYGACWHRYHDAPPPGPDANPFPEGPFAWAIVAVVVGPLLGGAVGAVVGWIRLIRHFGAEDRIERETTRAEAPRPGPS